MQYNRVRNMYGKADVRLVSNFNEFDSAINEKQREKIITIAH